MNKTSQKAHDIAFAVFRVATLIRNNKLRRELEEAAVDFISKFDEQVLTLGLPTVFDKLERLILLSKSIKEMKDINAEVLIRELLKLQAVVSEPIEIPARQEINIENDFNESENSENDLMISELPLDSAPTGKLELSNGLTERQTAILFKIRETEFCRLRNLMEAFPGVSERTIRNDIQVLIHSGQIKRVGNGGPASYFQSLEITPSLAETHVMKV